MTSMAITLAAPLEAPIINFDQSMNQYYFDMEREWAMRSTEMQSKLLLSFGSGARDILVPSSLTGSRYSDINALVCIFSIFFQYQNCNQICFLSIFMNHRH